MRPPRLDRIVRGRAWIPVLGAMLVAIVGLRVEVLKLGSTVGTQIQQATLLQSSNSTLRTQISALSDNGRIERLGEMYGMHMPSPLDVHFLQSAAGGHVQAAIRNITAPNDSVFLAGLAAEQQANQLSADKIAALNGAAPTPTAAGNAGTPSSSASAVGTGGAGLGNGSSASPAAGTGTSAGAGGGIGASAGGASSPGSTVATGSGAGAAGTTSGTAGGGTSGTSGSQTPVASTPASGAPAGASSTGLNTGPTNTNALSGGSPAQAAGSSASGGSGLAG